MRDEDSVRNEQPDLVEDDRGRERGDAAEPDAPTSAEQNDGMSTILSGDQGDGVQEDE